MKNSIKNALYGISEYGVSTYNASVEVVVGYFYNIFNMLSQVVNTLIGGDPNETISARGWRNRDTWWGATIVKVLDAVFFWQDDHCYQSHMADVHFARRILKL